MKSVQHVGDTSHVLKHGTRTVENVTRYGEVEHLLNICFSRARAQAKNLEA